MDQNITNYVRQQLANGQDARAVRDYLLKYYPAADVQAAINSVYAEQQGVALKNYIDQELRLGYGIDAIRKALVNQGYSAAAVDSAIGSRGEAAVKQVHVSKNAVVLAAIIVAGLLLGLSAYLYFTTKTKPLPKLLDVNLELASEELAPGDDLSFTIALANFGSFRGFDVTLEYTMKSATSVIATKTESLYLESSQNLVRKMKIPKSAEPGDYTIEARVTYEEYFATAMSSFKVVHPAHPTQGNGETPATPEGPETSNNETPTEEPAGPETKKSYDDMLYSEYNELIEETTDPNTLGAICIETNAPDYKDLCYFELAIAVTSEANCGKIGDSGNKDRCMRAIALKTRNQDMCSQVENSATRESCLMVINAANMFDDKGISYTIDIRTGKLDFNMTDAMGQFMPT